MPASPKEDAYVCALSPGYSPPAIFSRPSGLPSAPRHTPPDWKPQGELLVNPETLRTIASTVERMRSEVQQCTAGLHDAHARITMQVAEFRRQQTKCAQIVDTATRLRGADQQHVRDRLARVIEAQAALMKRLDKTLQIFMDAAHPNLSEHETKWFAEMDRMKQEVFGTDDGRSLTARADMV